MTDTHPDSPQRRPRGPRSVRWLALAALGIAAIAQADPFELIEGTSDGGGEYSQGTRFALEGSIGQPDAGTLTGTRFAIDGGFWRPAIAPQNDTIFSNSFEETP